MPLEDAQLRSSVLQEFLVRSNVGRADPFGKHVVVATRALFGNSVSPLKVLESHTFFGVYGRALSQEAAESWAQRQIQGSNNGFAFLRAGLQASFQFATKQLRACGTCVARDMDETGFPSWYVLHQLPPVHHCPIHGDELKSECNHRTHVTNWKLRLPTGSSVSCPELRRTAGSDGYAAYMRLWVELFEGKLSIVSADHWTRCTSAMVERLGSVDNAIREVSKSVSQLWGLSCDHVAQLLGSHVQETFVSNEVQRGGLPGRIAQKLVILTAYEAVGIVQTRQSGSSQMELALPSCDEFALQDQEFRSALVNRGFPLAFIESLLRGSSMRDVARSAGMNRKSVRKLLVELSTEQAAGRLPPSPKNAWLESALTYALAESNHDHSSKRTI
jgi:hypothetical protein